MNAWARLANAWRAFDGVRATATVAPWLAGAYLRSRIGVENLVRLYDAASSTQYHPARTGAHSGDAVMSQAGSRLRSHARYLDENHDLAIGILDVLVNRVVGTGLKPTPMVRDRAGQLHELTNLAIERLFRAWAKAPETSGEIPFAECQRLGARTLFRDGEVLVQHIQGGRFDHLGAVPYTIELLEPDYLPFERTQREPRIVHGVEKGAGGRVRAYHLMRQHPGDTGYQLVTAHDAIRIPAERIEHLKLISRIGQTRGVSIFHGVTTRLSDVKDYEESERIAARVAAAFTGYIRKGGDYAGTGTATAARNLEMAPGMIFDGLAPGEEIGTIGSNRPNPNLGTYVLDQVRRLAAGTGTGASSISRNYTGTYSAQRQELVETSTGYLRMFEYFCAKFIAPTFERFIETAELAGALRVPASVDRATLFDFECAPPGQPWIDPVKEGKADELALKNRFNSRQGLIRARGGDVRRIDAEIAQDTQAAPPAPATAGTAPAPSTDSANDEGAQAA